MSGNSNILGSKRTTDRSVEELKELIEYKRNSIRSWDSFLATFPPDDPFTIEALSKRESLLADLAQAEEELRSALSTPGNRNFW